MYGYYDMDWMLYAMLELVSIIDIIFSLIVLLRKISYEQYKDNIKFHIPFGIGILAVGMSRGIRMTASDLIDTYFLDVKYFIIQLITLLVVFGLHYLIKRRGQ